MIYKLSPSLGCDPELFLKDKDRVVGSEVLPELPLETGCGKVVRDGIQVELQPTGDNCRANLGNKIKHLIDRLGTCATRHTLTISFDSVVDLTNEEMSRLSPDSLRLGCMPSYNIYDPDYHLRADGSMVKTRSCGGHIQIGLHPEYYGDALQRNAGETINDTITTYVSVLDTLVGNTCVLLDRDPRAADRRKYYGKAGEYRLPAWGLEYRTLSNFWLRDYKLFSLVMGLARYATGEMFDLDCSETCTYRAKPSPNAHTLLDGIDQSVVKEAIDTNNFDLAWTTWEKIRSYLGTNPAGDGNSSSPLPSRYLSQFEAFVKLGIDRIFPAENARESWRYMEEGHGIGWESFIEGFNSTKKGTKYYDRR